ncbi:MAG: alcohol dehydrogenase catalytic domain-containing protein [Clostridia bacterium]|nr:alcohol dehydrogenase catalytic domain-containing protein [Clostridia bacterium]
MLALTYRFSPVHYALARAAGRRAAGLLPGPLSVLRLEEVPAPGLPGPDWVLVRPLYAGICGTDVALLRGEQSPFLSPFASFPAVPGHEVVGRVVDAGPLAPVAAGARVVVDPFLHCAVRGLPACPACRRGDTALCQRTTEGRFSPGLLLGFCRDLPGGWGELLAAHASQVFPVPEAVPDLAALLVEPLAVACHAVLRGDPPPPDPASAGAAPAGAEHRDHAGGDAVLVLGGGTIGLCLVVALRLLDHRGPVTLLARHPFQAELARALGADCAVTQVDADGLRDLQAAGALPDGVRALRPLVGRPLLDGGYDRVFDCVGSRASLELALRVTRPGGAVTLVGGAGLLPRLDATPVWARGLRVCGTVGYGQETVAGERLHTFELVLKRLAAEPRHPVTRLVTHRFPLRHYREALAACFDRRGSGAVKVAFAVAAEETADETADAVADVRGRLHARVPDHREEEGLRSSLNAISTTSDRGSASRSHR